VHVRARVGVGVGVGVRVNVHVGTCLNICMCMLLSTVEAKGYACWDSGACERALVLPVNAALWAEWLSCP